MESPGRRLHDRSTTSAVQDRVSGYIPTLDGWRAIAIVSVIAGHDKVLRAGLFSTSWLHNNGGERGVELFFALSGILICSRLLQEEQLRGRISLRGFYVLRICRIQPAALVYLAAMCGLMLAKVIAADGKGVAASVLLVRNYLPVHQGDGSWYTDHFWSLSIEEHFYLLLPGMLLLVRRGRFVVLAGAFVAAECGRQMLLLHEGVRPDVQFHSDCSAGPMLLGAAVAVLLVQPKFRVWCVRWTTPAVAVVITAAVWTLLEVHHGHFDHAALVFTLPLLIVSTMLHPRSALGRLLEWRPFKFVGRISYSLYLWQMLFFVFTYTLPATHSAVLNVLQNTPLRYVVVFLLAVTSYYRIELPMMRMGHRLAKPVTPGRDDMREDLQERAHVAL